MIRRLIRDEHGLSVVEFAICLPFLVLLYVGSYQLSDAISAQRKVTIATRAIADLTSQYTTVTNTDLDQILAASQQIMAPYKYSAAQLTITQVKIASNGTATVDWSRGLNAAALTPGSTVTLANNIKKYHDYVLIAQTTYTYTPIAASSMIGTIPMHDEIVLSPRSSSSITNTSIS